MGVKLQVLPNPDSLNYTWKEQTSVHRKGACDVVIGSMTQSAKPNENLDFPVTYYYALGSLAVHRDNTTITVPADASGKCIGVVKAAPTPAAGARRGVRHAGARETSTKAEVR
jgi:hypothetical protein